MNVDPTAVQAAFHAAFGRRAAGVVRAPGRVNLIGEHTDYNDGFVLPIAIDRCTLAAYASNGTDVARVATTAHGMAGPVPIPLTGPIHRGTPAWANYCRGVAAGLLHRGITLAGVDVLFDSTVPIGGGLSSSASLEVAAALAMLAAAGRVVADRDLALLCQKAEHDYAGTPCGIMDQSIAILGRTGHALLLDCRSGAAEQIPFGDPGKVVLVVDSQVKHELSDGGYAARRRQCYTAAGKLGVKMLRDADDRMVAQAASGGVLSGKELMRARHVVGEIRRTLEAVAALKVHDYAAFGRLMYQSHTSLRDDYEVSCAELDTVVESARRCRGVYGARMTGGGFGGCAIVLADTGGAGAVERTIAADYAAAFGRRCPVFATRAGAGAGPLL